jgi:hypothetical protein
VTTPSGRVSLLDPLGGVWVRSRMAPSTYDLVPIAPDEPRFVKWTREDIEALFGQVIEVAEPEGDAA